MSLATRCTACGTTFRVVEDQLRVSDGWVRCGRCAQVFDARELLFDIDRDTPPPWPPRPVEATLADPLPEPVAQSTKGRLPPDEKSEVRPDNQVDRRAETRFERSAEPAPSPPPSRASAPAQAPTSLRAAPAAEAEPSRFGGSSDFGDSRQEPVWIDPHEPASMDAMPVPHAARGSALAGLDHPDAAADDAAALARAEASWKDLPARSVAKETEAERDTEAAESTPPQPEFMRRAERAKRWQRPWVRVALSSASAVLLAALLAQFTWHFRDAIVAVYPPARASMQAMCEVVGCTIHPWRRLDSVGVELTELNPLGSSGRNYKLTVVLSNKSPYEVATPWLQLNLIGADGKLISRRALAPANFSPHRETLAPQTDVSFQALLTTQSAQVSTYLVQLFHP